MKKVFNAVCAHCRELRPRCRVVMLLRPLSNLPVAAATLCEDCRKLPDYRGRFRLLNDEGR